MGNRGKGQRRDKECNVRHEEEGGRAVRGSVKDTSRTKTDMMYQSDSLDAKKRMDFEMLQRGSKFIPFYKGTQLK